jgi:hypothetical protein
VDLGVRGHRADRAEARSDVADRGRRGDEGGDEVLAEEVQQQRADAISSV